MSNLRHSIFTLLLFLLASPPGSRAQLAFRNIGQTAGLADNNVHTVMKDRQGYVWIGTHNGLSRYDGYSVRPYLLTDPEGKTHDNILRMQQDRQGTLWVTVLDGTSFCYNPQTDAMDCSTEKHLARLGLKAAKAGIIIDHDGNLWTIDGCHLTYYSFTTRKPVHITLPETVSSVDCRQGQAYALTASHALYRLFPSQKKGQRIATYPSPSASNLRLFLDSRLQLWVYDRYVAGLYRLNTLCGTLEKTNNENVSALAEDANGTMWIGTNSNGILLRRQDGSTQRITRNEQTPFPLLSNHISTIYIDNSQMVWVGTSKLGVGMTNPNNTGISVIDTPYNEDIGFLCQDAQGSLWIGYDGSGLYNVSTGKLFSSANSVLASDLVIGGQTDGRGNMLIGTYGGGIYCMNAKGNLTPISPGQPLLHYARRMVHDKEGKLWIGAVMNGLCCLDTHGRLQQFNYKNSPLRTNAVTDVAYCEAEDELLVATSTGLYTVHCQRRSVVPFADKSLQTALINVVAFDQQGRRWVCTNDEVRVYDRQLHLLRTFGKEYGLDHVMGMVADRQGSMWLTTNDAVYNIKVENKGKKSVSFHLQKFTAADGLGDISFCKRAIYCTHEGDILAGGCGKFARLSPACLPQNKKHNRLTVTELKVNGQAVPPNQWAHTPLTLKYGESLWLTVSTLDYTHAAHLPFAFRLDDEPQWTSAEANVIRMSRLPRGEHCLQVKQLDGTDNVALQLSLRILPPFWLSPVAIGIYLLLCVVGVWMVWKLRRLRNVNRTLPADGLLLALNAVGSSVPYEESVQTDSDHSLLDRATRVVENHLSENEFSVEDFSREMGLSRSALYKKLMAATGKSPLEFMRAIRLRHGLQLVEEGSLSISEIAYRTGFSPKQFSKFFKEQYGSLPSQYKKQ